MCWKVSQRANPCCWFLTVFQECHLIPPYGLHLAELLIESCHIGVDKLRKTNISDMLSMSNQIRMFCTKTEMSAHGKNCNSDKCTHLFTLELPHILLLSLWSSWPDRLKLTADCRPQEMFPMNQSELIEIYLQLTSRPILPLAHTDTKTHLNMAFKTSIIRSVVAMATTMSDMTL